jgi:acetyl-CoA carboxylase carboxyltransferase component
MAILTSQLQTNSETYQANLAVMRAAVEKLRKEMAVASAGGDEKYRERHQARGKLLPRERIARLLDEGSYFLEIAPLAGHGIEGQSPGAGVIGGIGLVEGVECLVIANEATVKAGAITEWGMAKLERLAGISLENRLPVVYLVESAGIDLPRQSRIFVRGGREFRDLTRRSKARVPTVALVFGTSTAGGAYIPGMSDYTIMVKRQAKIFLGGPPLVKMATGEVVEEEALGGAEMHSQISGVSDFLAEDEPDALRMAREVVGSLNWRKAPGPAKRFPVEGPLYPAEELLGIVSANPRIPFDAREIIARLVDGSRFVDFKPRFGSTLVTGYAHVQGYPIGILANDGVLTSESACKGAQFIELCNQQHVPLLFLQNVTGFMVGRSYEEGGIVRHGAKLINAVSNSTVPAITIMIGNSYGAGNYAMCGRAYEPRFLFTWPNHRIGVMGPQQLAGVMEIIKREAGARAKKPVPEEELTKMRRQIEGQLEGETDCYFATAHLWDDGILDPRDTRTVVAICLSACYNRSVRGTMAFGVFRH